jgi:streptomycin 6-kinase
VRTRGELVADFDLRSLDLPDEFVRYNQVEPAWLSSLPTLLERLAARWSLTFDSRTPFFSGIRINYVAPVTAADGAPCVLKVSRHLGDTRNEIAALKLWNGQGAAQLLEADPDLGALVLERLEPGTMLVDVAEDDDDAATVIAARLLDQLWRPVPEGSGLRSLESWCDAFERNREALSRGDRGFPAALFGRADALRQELLDSTVTPTVLHGDLHHFNVLRSGRAPWLAIDPKGLTGDRCFDVCQFFRNPYPYDPPNSVNSRRLDIFCAELGLDRERTKAWCFVHSVLDACWSFEDGHSWERSVARAEEKLAL